MKQAVLIDGKWLAYRMHFSHMSLRTSAGHPTGILHGFLSELINLNKKLPEAKIIVCWDGKGKTWRHKRFPAYKGTRAFNPEFKRMELQIELLLPLLRKLGLWVLEQVGVEADDMIGMAATRLSELGYEVRIYSKDKDMFQLVDDTIWVWPDTKQPPLKRKDVENWLGAPLNALVDIRAMAGDPGDNLKGLPGVGLVTAVKIWKRMSASSKGLAEVVVKYKGHWPRIAIERRVAEIITSPDADVWDSHTSQALNFILNELDERPERNVKKGEKHKREIYQFLSKYELNDLLALRLKFFQLP